MNDKRINTTGGLMEPTVIALAQDGNRLRGVCLGKRARAFEILWHKSSDTGVMNWHDFASECGLSTEPGGQRQSGGGSPYGLHRRTIVVGFDSAGVIFYRIVVPAAKEEEIGAIIRLQAEARLPLPIEQMELAWRADRVKDGEAAVTTAAARREHLEKFVENVRVLKPAHIILDCEALITVWREFFSGRDERAVVVSIGSRETRLCLADGARLINAMGLDLGTDDFSVAKELGEQDETAERFAQDIRSALELFGCSQPQDVAVFVLSDGSNSMRGIVSCLVSAGLNVREALPECERDKIEEIYQYRVPIGLALIGFDGAGRTLNIFERLYRPVGMRKGERWWYSPKATGAIAAVMLILLLFVSYVVDVAKLGAIERHLQATRSETNHNSLAERQKLIKAIELRRPDLLQLLREINISGTKGVLLDSVYFEQGRAVTISGQADGADQLYKFQENLLSVRGIKDVRIESAPQDSKSKKIKFTMSFRYRWFSEKQAK